MPHAVEGLLFLWLTPPALSGSSSCSIYQSKTTIVVSSACLPDDDIDCAAVPRGKHVVLKHWPRGI